MLERYVYGNRVRRYGKLKSADQMKQACWTIVQYGAPRGSLWQADHIVPVAEGGGECGLDNLRTLCTPCHKAAIAALRKRLAEERRWANQLTIDQE
jgi:5-methylcytosine-specific restriction endonuclease McrA